MATAMSIVTATVFSVFLFDTAMTEQFLVGATMVLPSVYLYSNSCESLVDQQNYGLTTFLRHFPWTRVYLSVNLFVALLITLALFNWRLLAFAPLDESSFSPNFGQGCSSSVSSHSFGMHSVRQDISKEERPPGMSDTEWVLSKQFSDIEDADLLAEWEKTRPEEEQNILTFVMSVTDGYDIGPIDVSMMPLANHSKVKFLFLSDDLDYVVPLPWEHVKIDYPSLDRRVDFGYRNSLSRLIQYVNDTGNPRQHHYANMWTKYFCHISWRIPELRKSRYIAYAGGGVNLQKIPYEFYDRFMKIMSDGNHRFHMYDPTEKNLYDEAKVASWQQRYAIDDVITQTEWYASNFQIPANDSKKFPLFWLALSFYDNYHAPTRQVSFDTWVECQLWSLEDQISYPVSIYVNGEVNTTKMVTVFDLLYDYLGLTNNDTFRFAHTTLHYGA